MENTLVKAKYIKAKISPKKVAPVMDLIRGNRILDAKVKLAFDRSKAAKMVLKVLKSAEANAINNNNLKSDILYVSEAWVGSGPMMKTGMAGPKGRSRPILKRSSHIYVTLSDNGLKTENLVKGKTLAKEGALVKEKALVKVKNSAKIKSSEEKK